MYARRRYRAPSLCTFLGVCAPVYFRTWICQYTCKIVYKTEVKDWPIAKSIALACNWSSSKQEGSAKKTWYTRLISAGTRTLPHGLIKPALTQLFDNRNELSRNRRQHEYPSDARHESVNGDYWSWRGGGWWNTVRAAKLYLLKMVA